MPTPHAKATHAKPAEPKPARHEVDNGPVIEMLRATGCRIRDDANPGYWDTDPDLCRLWSDGRYVAARRLMFHWMVIEGDVSDHWGYDDRWCMETYEIAATAVRAYPDDWPRGFEPPGWHRHPKTGRRREDGDPAKEYRDP